MLLIGSPMDSTGFRGLASALAGVYTVVTYDPRGMGNSSRDDADTDMTPEQQADDVHHLLSELGSRWCTCSAAAAGAWSGSRWSPRVLTEQWPHAKIIDAPP